MVSLTLKQGFDVIVDATSVDLEARTSWVKIAKSCGAMTRIVYLKTPMEVCLARNAKDKVKPIPEVSIRSMSLALEMEPPEKKEVDKLVVVEYSHKKHLKRRTR